MSTFNGILPDFPTIRIDHFRPHHNHPPPLACLLSHVHSDHLVGLDSPVLPFIYCSVATARLLLRLEKSNDRLNFERGILETRKATYRHLRKLVKPLPLGTPTILELSPKVTIRVTLFDANHCPGAVMFLIEGDGRAILYTGDVRAETWWIESLLRHPVLLPYSLGNKTFDCIYLDTTFAAREDIYRVFPSKAAGLAELIQKVTQYPPETVFYFRTWTLGYEDAWLALAAALNCRIHVDRYQMHLYSGLAQDSSERLSVPEAAGLVGFDLGNHFHAGCLTDKPDVLVRIHSCEPGTACHADIATRKDTVWVTPIISRTDDGTELYEVGAGGIRRDPSYTTDRNVKRQKLIEELKMLGNEPTRGPSCSEKFLDAIDKMTDTDPTGLERLALGVHTDSHLTAKLEESVKSLSEPLLSRNSSRPATARSPDDKLPVRIHFPYSRHSSYSELRNLISAFKPKDIYPCTFDLSSWNEDVTMQSLFGDLCSEQVFAYDAENRVAAEEWRNQEQNASRKRKRNRTDDGDTQRSSGVDLDEDTFETGEGALDPELARDILLTEQHNEKIAISDKTVNASAQADHQQLESCTGPSPDLNRPLSRLHAIEAAYQSLDHVPATSSKSWSNFWPPEVQNQPFAVQSPERSYLPLPPPNVFIEDGKDDENTQPQADTQVSSASLSLSAFASQPESQSILQPTSPTRLQARKEAYHAAQKSMQGDSSLWNELSLRSCGHEGHEHEEREL